MLRCALLLSLEISIRTVLTTQSCNRIISLLESVVAKFKGWNPKAYQEPLIFQIKSRLIELSGLCTYVKNTHEFVTEQRSVEAERRAREAERMAALALVREAKIREEAERKEREAREKARAEAVKKQELKQRIAHLETTVLRSSHLKLQVYNRTRMAAHRLPLWMI